MFKVIAVLLVALVLEAVGVVLLSQGLKQIGNLQEYTLAEYGRLFGRGVTNPSILMGVFLEAIFFGALLFLLKVADVSLVWPMTSLGFVLTTLAAKFLRGEDVSAVRWSGVVLIMLGAALVGYSEALKSPKTGPQTAARAGSDFSTE